MTFTERLKNTVFFLLYLIDRNFDGDAVFRYAREMPYISLDTLVARAEVWLVQMDHILDYPIPTLPNVKLIGGMPARFGLGVFMAAFRRLTKLRYQALYHAVPMVGLPLFYDQFYNAQRMKVKGFGKVVNFQDLTASKLVDVIDEVASDPALQADHHACLHTVQGAVRRAG
nr:hypothetical protein BaRGS_024030 [Batillaria attramentaria]